MREILISTNFLFQIPIILAIVGLSLVTGDAARGYRGSGRPTRSRPSETLARDPEAPSPALEKKTGLPAEVEPRRRQPEPRAIGARRPLGTWRLTRKKSAGPPPANLPNLPQTPADDKIFFSFGGNRGRGRRPYKRPPKKGYRPPPKYHRRPHGYKKRPVIKHRPVKYHRPPPSHYRPVHHSPPKPVVNKHPPPPPFSYNPPAPKYSPPAPQTDSYGSPEAPVHEEESESYGAPAKQPVETDSYGAPISKPEGSQEEDEYGFPKEEPVKPDPHGDNEVYGEYGFFEPEDEDTSTGYQVPKDDDEDGGYKPPSADNFPAFPSNFNNFLPNFQPTFDFDIQKLQGE